MNSQHDDVYWMQQALQQAQKALDAGEVPVGAVVVYQNECIATGYNAPIGQSDPTAHAEVNALRLAAKKLSNYRLQGCTLYVTLEPCAMCAMAMLHARVDRVVYGAIDPKTGAAGSIMNLFAYSELNHQTQITGGVLAEECSTLLKQFFIEKRLCKTAPLCDDALRTSENSFLPSKLGQGAYTSNLPSLNGLQLCYHYLPVLTKLAPTLLCIHDKQGFSEQYADFVPEFIANGYSVLLPDLIGFGRSDKPKKTQWHTPAAHAAYLSDLVHCLFSKNSPLIIIAPQSLSALLVPLLQYLKAQSQDTVDIKGIYWVRKLPALSQELQKAPFPNKGYCSALTALNSWEKIDMASQFAVINCTVHDTLENCVIK